MVMRNRENYFFLFNLIVFLNICIYADIIIHRVSEDLINLYNKAPFTGTF